VNQCAQTSDQERNPDAHGSIGPWLVLQGRSYHHHDQPNGEQIETNGGIMAAIPGALVAAGLLGNCVEHTTAAHLTAATHGRIEGNGSATRAVPKTYRGDHLRVFSFAVKRGVSTK
jgi:hypothetical protein